MVLNNEREISVKNGITYLSMMEENLNALKEALN